VGDVAKPARKSVVSDGGYEEGPPAINLGGHKEHNGHQMLIRQMSGVAARQSSVALALPERAHAALCLLIPKFQLTFVNDLV
jgi:hypothetical protein